MIRRALLVAAGLLPALALAGAGVVWSWTHTPHGKLDVGAAIAAHTMPAIGAEISAESRRQANGWMARFRQAPEPSVAIRDLRFPGPAGELPLRLYTPPGEGPVPVVVWIHGGGFFMGDELSLWDGSCSRLAAAVGALVVSIGYRLAPEHPFPAAVEDTFAALRFAAAHAPEWSGDASRLAVMGGSAGGNLAAVVAQRARREGGPRLVYQVLVVPALQAGLEPTPSLGAFSKGYGLDGIPKMIAAYLPDPADRRHPWASPLFAEDLAGLPPALILTAAFDPLRDEGEAYAERLRAAGVPVALRRFEGAIHGFLGSPGDARAAEAAAVQALREAFGS